MALGDENRQHPIPSGAPTDYDRVADIYDVYVASDLDIGFYLEEAGKVRGKVLELMCGTGRVSVRLLEAGVDLTCVDASEEMLARLKESEDSGVVDRIQLHEFFDASNNFRAKRVLPMRIALVERSEFAELADAAGFVPVALYGDYDRGEYLEDSSHFMIWILEKERRP